jgi:hypothetical protein
LQAELSSVPGSSAPLVDTEEPTWQVLAQAWLCEKRTAQAASLVAGGPPLAERQLLLSPQALVESAAWQWALRLGEALEHCLSF